MIKLFSIFTGRNAGVSSVDDKKQVPVTVSEKKEAKPEEMKEMSLNGLEAQANISKAMLNQNIDTAFLKYQNEMLAKTKLFDERIPGVGLEEVEYPAYNKDEVKALYEVKTKHPEIAAKFEDLFNSIEHGTDRKVHYDYETTKNIIKAGVENPEEFNELYLKFTSKDKYIYKRTLAALPELISSMKKNPEAAKILLNAFDDMKWQALSLDKISEVINDYDNFKPQLDLILSMPNNWRENVGMTGGFEGNEASFRKLYAESHAKYHMENKTYKEMDENPINLLFLHHSETPEQLKVIKEMYEQYPEILDEEIRKSTFCFSPDPGTLCTKHCLEGMVDKAKK